MLDKDEPMASVVELKASELDKMSDRRLRRNVVRHIRQVSAYGEAVAADKALSIEYVCLAVVYSTEPKDLGRRDWIEQRLAEDMVAVFWHDTKRGGALY